MSEPAIELFFDVVSPYSYLASTQLEGLEDRTGRRVALRPFLLGAVMKATGNAPPATVAARARYLGTDLQRWAEIYDVPFRFASRFPAATLRAQRALLAAEARGGPEAIRALTHTLFRGFWVEDRDVNDPGELRALAERAGLDPEVILDGAADPAIKQRLIEQGEEAVARGAYGAPTFFVGEAMFFGNDRIAHLERFVRGELSA